MAWAVFHEEVHWSRPGCRFGFHAKANPEPQNFPHDFVEHAVSIGRATKTKPPKRQQTPKVGA
jgi:hypothetical protein